MARTFGALLREARQAAGFSGRQLAGSVGISANYLSRVERDAEPAPSADKIVRLAEALSREPDDFFIVARQLPPDVVTILERRPDLWNAVREAANSPGGVGLLKVSKKPQRETPHPELVPEPAVRPRRELDRLFGALQHVVEDGLRHGAFECRVMSELGRGRDRNVTIHAGKILRFIVPAPEIDQPEQPS